MKKSVEFFWKTVCIILLMVISTTQTWGVELRVVKDANGIVYQLYAIEGSHSEDSAYAVVIPDPGYQYLDSIDIPATIKDGDSTFVVRSIRDAAFKDCRGLKCFTLSDKLKSIGDSAFYGCTKLTEIVVPKGITTLTKNTFAGCTSVTRLTLSIPHIQEWFTSIKSQITELILGEGVLTLGDGAFYEFRNVREITLPSSLYAIKANAFKSWDALTSITLPANLAEISPLAFTSCTNLDVIKVDERNTLFDSRGNCNAVIETATNKLVLGCSETVIPNSVTEIGYRAFYGTDLRSVTIPANVSKINAEAFNYCGHLESITVASGNATYSSPDDCNAIVENSKNWILFGCCKTVIPETVDSIAPRAFAGVSKEMKIILPKSFAKVNKQAFHDCTGLTAICLPFNVGVIDAMAFYGCKNLKYIMEEDGQLEKFYIPDNIYEIKLQAFRDCSALDTLMIPASLGVLGREVFMNCSGLKKVTIEPGFIKSLPYGTFQNCSNLQEVVLPNDASFALEEKAFYGCNKIKRVYCMYKQGCPKAVESSFGDISNTALYAYQRNPEDGDVWYQFGSFVDMASLNQEFGGIYYNVKDGYVEVTTDQVDETGNDKPYKYSGDIVIPDSVIVNEIKYPVKSIEENAFKAHPAITSVTVGAQMQAIGESAFEDCTGLKSVTMDNCKNLMTIGPAVFKGCTALENVTLSDSTEVISDEAFMNCGLIEDITLPKALAELGESAFANCSKLKAVTIPNAVTVIDNKAFYHCDALTKATLHKNVTDIKAFAFGYCQKLADIILPEKLDSIGQSAFIDCRSLTDITLPANTKSIGKAAFRYCNGLKNIQLPKVLQKVEYQAFANCGNLTTIALPEAVTTVGDQAFLQCGKMISLTIEQGVKEMGEMAFSGCPLVNIYCKPVTPPSAFENTFSTKAYQDATLFLPEGVDSTYNYHVVWKLFAKRGSLAKYELKYIYDDNQVFKKDSVNGGAIITPAAIPVNGTHRFSGWKGEPELMPAKDTTIVGNFLYGISFLVKKDGKIVVDKDTLIQDKNLPDSLFYGEKVVAPKSWKDGFGIRWQELPETMPAKDTVIVGQYAINKYAVTYMVDGQFYRRDSVEYQEKVVPPTMQKDNYVFEWGQYPATMPAKDITVYGQFIPQIFADGINIRINKEEKTAEVIKYGNTVTTATSVVIPDSVTLEGVSYPVTSIAENAFNGFKQMQSVTLPKTLESIGEQAFRDCQSLTSITIPDKVTAISYGTFMYCGNLKEVNLHPQVTTIGSKAFFSCGSLTDVHLNNVMKIDSEAFSSDYKIVRVYSDATEVPQLASNAFETVVYQNATVYVDVNILEQYEADAVWKQFTNFDYIATYTVTYILNGKEYKVYDYKTGEEIAKEPNPVDGTRIFSGWSETPAVMEHEDIVVTGNFRYILEYKFEGKTVGRKSWVFCGTAIETPAVEEKDGYLVYWENAPETMPDQDTTVVGYYIPMGDVNNDKVIDVEDIVMMVNAILGEQHEHYMAEAGDLNDDGIVDIADIVLVINKILEQDSASAPQMRQILIDNGFMF